MPRSEALTLLLGRHPRLAADDASPCSFLDPFSNWKHRLSVDRVLSLLGAVSVQNLFLIHLPFLT